MELTKKFADEALQPLIEYAKENPGTITKLAARLSELTGATQYRQNIGEWLHPDPAKRIEPRFGMGLLLLDVYRTELNGAPAKGQDKPRKPRQPRKPRKPGPRKGGRKVRSKLKK